jgi:MoaA/NifB/PqqE/SkfB family radical SAM enzyme
MKFGLPNKYEIEISADCNAACPLCARTHQGLPLRGNGNITLADIKRIFNSREFIEGNKFNLVGVLGDPILNPECLEICEYLSINGAAQILFNTNAGYQTAEWWERLAKIPKMDVEFSIDGHRETNHIYRVNTKWEIVERNLEAYVNAGGLARWMFIPFEHNECELDIAVEHANRLGIEFQYRTSGRNVILPKTSHTVKNKNTKTSTQLNIKESTVYKHHAQTDIKNTERAVRYKNIEELKKIRETVSCKHFNERRVYIGADLTLWPCCWVYDVYAWQKVNPNFQEMQHPGLKNLPTGFNDLRQHTIEEILDNEFFTKLEQRWDPESDKFIYRCLKTCGNNAAYVNNHTTKNR